MTDNYQPQGDPPYIVDTEALGRASFARTLDDMGPVERKHARVWKADTWHGAGVTEETRAWHCDQGRRCLAIVNDAIAIEIMSV